MHHMRHLLAIAGSSTLVLQVALLGAAPGAGPVRAGAVQAPAAAAIITGTVQSASGQTLESYRVQVRDLQTGRVAATGASGPDGAFSFAGLPRGGYVVEAGPATGGIAAAMPAAANGIVKLTVSAAAAPGLAAVTTTTTAEVVARAAAAAGIAGVVASAERVRASPTR
jgi:Carboxypeptidase regulatory-like domain